MRFVCIMELQGVDYSLESHETICGDSDSHCNVHVMQRWVLVISTATYIGGIGSTRRHGYEIIFILYAGYYCAF